MSGRFITLEGGEGAGKSTQARRLAAALGSRSVACIVTREPGGSPGADDIRKLPILGEPGCWDALTELLLLFAARADHVSRTIRPALDAGKFVICDRFTDSTYAYQGVGHGTPRETIRRIESVVLQDFKPDMTLILDLPVDEGLKRASASGGAEIRFENFATDFHEKLRRGFLDIARRSPDRCTVVDAAGGEDDVALAIWDAVSRRFSL